MRLFDLFYSCATTEILFLTYFIAKRLLLLLLFRISSNYDKIIRYV